MSDRLDKWNVANVYKYVVARKTGKRVEAEGANIQYYS
jgi:hypothetical protein